jgi:hypothetical protein
LPSAPESLLQEAGRFDWVLPLEAPFSTGIRPEEASGGVLHLLVDRQLHAERGEVFFHVAGRVLNDTGLQAMSLLRFEFDPGCQTPFIHAIDVVRDGQRQNRLCLDRFSVMAVEREIERFVYNGAMAAVLHLEDVRVGDTVEWACTLRGENPLYPGSFWSLIPLGYPFPVGLLHQRLLASSARRLTLRPFSGASQPSLSEKDGLVERAWRLSDVRARAPEDDVPAWCTPFPYVQVTEQSSWAEVADWAQCLFPEQAEPDPLLDAQVAAIAAQSPTPAERIVAALRFVQGEVRYLAFNDGASPMRARRPATVLRQRYGDCKDKSWLLCHLLRALGLDAAPALVNTRLQGRLGELAPSINVFNHCVVRLNLEGVKRWYDPSAPRQGGRFDSVAFFSEQALEVAPGIRELTAIAPVRSSYTLTRETFRWLPESNAVLLAVETTHSGASADFHRVVCAVEGVSNLERRFLNFYAGHFGQVERSQPVSITDDLETNRLTLRESYRLADPWKPAEKPSRVQLFITAHPLLELLRVPQVKERTLPYSLGPPAEAEYQAELHHDGDLRVDSDELTVDTPFWLFEKKVQPYMRSAAFRYRLVRKRDHVPAAELPEYMQTLERIRTKAGVVYARNLHARATNPARNILPVWLFTLLVVGILAILRECVSRF